MHHAHKIVVLGAAESGIGAALLAQKLGFDVFVSDKKTINEGYKQSLVQHRIAFEENGHSMPKILAAHEVIISPGIPLQIPMVQQIKAADIPVISEIEFAYRHTKAHLIAITGSNGKSTTATLTYELLKAGGLDVALAGNIGKSFAATLAERDHDYFVLEISSFQLDSMFKFKADVAILLNITPDHLDRYNYQFDAYAQSKMRIGMNQTSSDVFIYNADDIEITNRINKLNTPARLLPFSQNQELQNEGAYRLNQELIFKINNDNFTMNIEKLALQGRHNAYNTMAGGIAAKLQEIRKESIKNCLIDFQGIAHRLEKIADVRGVSFINDSKATNVNSTWYALESMSKPVVLILGGQDKGNDYSSLIELSREKVKAIVCLGIDNRKIFENFNGVVPTIIETMTASEAVQSAFYLASPGDVVLLSPACASFDLFESYEDRGNRFRRAVQDL